MAQKTNLNVSPYFDDFSQEDQGAKDKNYYRVLFKPGTPIQAREVNTLQSILQDQIETFGSHIFKEGSVVIPGNISYDNNFYAVKLNQTQYNVYISSYLTKFIGKKIIGQISGVSAVIQHIELPNSDVEYPTIYVKYIDSDSNFEINPFQDNEEIYATEDVEYGTTTIISGTPFCSTISSNSTAIGSAASINDGVYFIRGSFVRVPKQTIVLDYYTNTPSYRIGLRINEQLISSKDDSSLNDNAKGFTNYSAPGADRLKITLTLSKKPLSDTNDTDFVELLKLKDGAIKKIETKSSYSVLKDYIAQRTYDESGDYVVTPFQFSLNNSLNDRVGNDGLFFDTEKTEQGNTPSDDLMCLKFSPGKAYVRGYDIEKTGIEIVDVEKPRTTQTASNVNIPFEMGNLLRVNTVSGSPKHREVVYLQDAVKNSNTVAAGNTVGSARVYDFTVTDSAHTGNTTNWDLYLFDVQTYTSLTLNQSVSSTEIPATSFIKGMSSGASGYAVSNGSGSSISLRQTSGTFIIGEKILINGSEQYSRTITAISVYSIDDVKSVFQPQPSGFTTAFVSTAQTSKILNEEKGFLYAQIPDSNIANVNLSNSTITFSAQSNTNFPASTSLTVNTSNFNLGINSTTAKFEAFDEERYSISYSDGTLETLTPDKVSINSGSNQVTFSNISNKQISSIRATFVKLGIQSKVKQYTRSKTVNISLSKNPQSGIGVNNTINDGLTYNKFYGLRVQDEEICLNYPDVAKIIGIYESLDTSSPILDSVSFSSIANVDTNAIIGENIIGTKSGSVARIVSKPSSNTLRISYLNNNRFIIDEEIRFEESNILTPLSAIIPGNYKNITNKFDLDKGQKEQYYDYSKIIRKSGESSPSRQLLVVFDYYSVPDNDSGDVFTVNSYEEKVFSNYVPYIGKNNIRSTDTLDFRPRVSVFTGNSSSPFDFSSRNFTTEPKLILSPNESALIGYDFYLGRIDKLYLDKLGVFTVLKGTPSVEPKPPSNPDDVMEIATITLPPYLYNPKNAEITLVDNRRYTMRDIGKIEDRLENLERVTSLSLLEVSTQSLQIQDAQGLSRFKSGFFVDDFKNTDLINVQQSKIKVDEIQSELTTQISANSLNLKPVQSVEISDNNLDLSTNFNLFDSNTQKTGDVITLKYESVDWIEQTFATKVENVNPFNVVSYSGSIKLNPSSDSWKRTIQLQDVNIINQANWVWLRATGTYRVVGSETTTNIENRLISNGTELYMRSRNTGFSAVNLKPFTRVYQFLDGNSGVDFIPKLIEISIDSTLQNYGSSGSFQIGETVTGTGNGASISFRVSSPNHKEGGFNNPSTTYTTNPYQTNELIPSSYSPSSKILNVDIESLCSEVQGLYSGYLTVGMKLVGQTSGAVAYVKDLRLITDANGFISGAFYLRDPNTNPPPSVRIATGTKVYKLSSSSTNQSQIPGSTLISSAETIYKAEGTWEERQKITTTSTSIYFEDPLAQSFSVGGVADTTNGNKANEDVNGAYLTSVDLYFARKDNNNAPLTVEVRTVELGTPTRNILGKSVTLNPDKINVSSDASIATKVTFSDPIYLAPGLEYAIVILSPQSDQYEVWIAEMGQKTIETANLPDSQAVRYTRQFAIGSLFKSQNGSIWTANQYQDLKFKLYKANFTAKTGSVLFHNPTLDQSNNYVPKLNSNSLTILPKKYTIGITTIYDSGLIGILTTGRKVSSQTPSYSGSYGYIVGTGSSVPTTGVVITTGGTNYTTTSEVETYNITGNGTGLKLSITASGAITGIAVSNPGNGYAVGDVVGIVTSTVSSSTGRDARITISAITGLDTLYLSNVQGSSFNSVGISTLVYYDDSGTAVSLASTQLNSRSSAFGGIYSGNFFKVKHYNHGMYAKNNKLTIFNVESDVPPTTLSIPLSSTDTTISIASTTNFGIFEGLAVTNANTAGYVKIDDEIIKYQSVNNGQLLSLERGIDSTKPTNHDLNSLVYKYELGGVSLRRINTNHDISDTGIDIDEYYIEFNRGIDRGIDRSSDIPISNIPELSFNSEQLCGGTNIRSSENIQFNSIIPHIGLLSPTSSTFVTGEIKTVSGTSVSGNEISFIDQGYEAIELEKQNTLNTTRIVCSNINESTYLSSLLRSKSFTMKINLSTTDSNLSPLIFWKNCSVELNSNRLNKPLFDYISDSRVNTINEDPHAATYISNTVRLAQPATSLKVIISAYRHSSADFRVLYSLIRPDSSEIEQSFELFPGYNNLTIDNNNDGYLDVIDASKNSGLPDVFVPASLNNQFLDYEFSANNLGSFTGYTIKIVMSGTDQANAPRFKDLRSIALA
jgi:hypothetical protein